MLTHVLRVILFCQNYFIMLRSLFVWCYQLVYKHAPTFEIHSFETFGLSHSLVESESSCFTISAFHFLNAVFCSTFAEAPLRSRAIQVDAEDPHRQRLELLRRLRERRQRQQQALRAFRRSVRGTPHWSRPGADFTNLKRYSKTRGDIYLTNCVHTKWLPKATV
jgi:sRNA-binding regulator protein Hfq